MVVLVGLIRAPDLQNTFADTTRPPEKG